MKGYRSGLKSVKELISEVNALRFQIAGTYRGVAGSMQSYSMKVHADILQALRQLRADQEDLDYMRRVLKQNRNLIATLSEVLNSPEAKDRVPKLKKRLDQKYCQVQLYLSEMEIPVKRSEEVSV